MDQQADEVAQREDQAGRLEGGGGGSAAASAKAGVGAGQQGPHPKAKSSMWGLRDVDQATGSGQQGLHPKAKSSMWGLRDVDQATGAGGSGRPSLLGAQGGHTFSSPASHLPHPASGAVRYGKRHISPEAAGLFSTIASLASMGLLLRVSAGGLMHKVP